MKKILTTLFLFFYCSLAYTQTGWIRLHSDANLKIYNFKSVPYYPSGTSHIYFQKGSGTGYNPLGDYYRLDKNTGSVAIPFNNFIGLWWAMYPYPPYTMESSPVSDFAISPHDSNFIIHYRESPAAWCPDARTYLTQDAGINYNEVFNFNCGGIMVYPHGMSFDPVNTNIMYFAYPEVYANNNNTIFKSTNSGANWTGVDTISDLRSVGSSPYAWGMFSGGFMEVNPWNNQFVYIAGLNNLYISTSGGYNFFDAGIPAPNKILFDSQNQTTIGYTNGAIYKSTDNGLTWITSVLNISGIDTIYSLIVSPDNSNIMYLGSKLGLHRSIDEGNTWNIYNNSFTPSREVIGLSKDLNSGDTLIACTKDGIYKVWADHLVGISQNPVIPQSYSLNQNYPNPFNPSTNISFDIPKSAFVELKVFDITGKLVSTLVNESLSPGSYNFSWDAASLSSGIYFYTLKSESFISTKKMVLLK